MKKVIMVMMVMVLIFAFAGCGSENSITMTLKSDSWIYVNNADTYVFGKTEQVRMIRYQ